MLKPFEYSSALRDRIAENLAQHDRRSVPDSQRSELKSAAVAVVIVDSKPGSDHTELEWLLDDAPPLTPGGVGGSQNRMRGVSGGAAFVLCRRSPRLNSHPRQFALPGGKVDPGETIVEAALRELDEELGVSLGEEAVLGQLDDYPTRSGYLMSPVVVWGGTALQLKPEPDEVVAAYRIGLHELSRDDSPRYLQIAESDRPVIELQLGDEQIYAPTGAVLMQFRWVGLEGRIGERVDQYEQPVFAWE